MPHDRDVQGREWSACDHCPHPTPSSCPSRRHRRYCELAASGPAGAALVAREPAEDRPGREIPPEQAPRPTPPPDAPGPRPIRHGGPPLRSAPPGRRAILRTFLNDYSGFGRFGLNLGRALESAGVPVRYDVVAIDEGQRPVSDWQRGRIEPDAPELWRLQAHYLGFPVAPGRATVYFTMHETSGLKPEHVAEFNRSVAMIVPCTFNARTFRESGVNVPIHVVPPGLDRGEGFEPRPGMGGMRTDGPFRVLFAAMLQAGGMRKGVHDAIDGFRRAFPAGDRRWKDAELIVKVWPTCLPHLGSVPDDPRIRVVTDAMTTHRLADLYRECTVLLAPTRGEGWGLHTHESMSCGVPPIVPFATATADFVDDSTGYPIEFDWRPAEGYYEGMGDWCVPRPDSIAHQLRRAYLDRDEVARKGRAASGRALSYTWEATGRRLKAVLNEIGMLIPEHEDAGLAARFAPVGRDVWVGSAAACRRYGPTFDRIIHIRKAEDEHICEAGTPGLRLAYRELEPFATMAPAVADVIEYARQPGRLLCHCAGAHCRGPSLAALSLAARGECPEDAVRMVREAVKSYGLDAILPPDLAGWIRRALKPKVAKGIPQGATVKATTGGG